MDIAFPINKIATGAAFLSREKDADTLASNLVERRHTLIYDSKKSGKHSLVRNALNILDNNGVRYILIHVNLFRCRTEEAMLKLFTESLCRTLADSSCELPPSINESISQMSGLPDILSLPETIASQNGTRIIVWFDEFQNILNFDQSDETLRLIEKHILKHDHVTYIIMGSKINAMNFIMERMEYFPSFSERILLQPLNEDEVTRHISRVFQKVGRIISKKQTKFIYDCSQGNPWLIWRIANSCFNLTRGYVTDDLINESINIQLVTFEMRFHDIIDSLSNYQLQLLRAVYDGEVKLNSQDVIDHYGLSSSANVHRLKEALMKKEVITFDDKNNPRIIDPLFLLWLKTRYFI